MLDDDVRIGEINDLVPLFGNGYPGNHHVPPALGQSWEDAFPGRRVPYRNAVHQFADLNHHIHIETDHLFGVLIDVFMGRIGWIGADLDHFPTEIGSLQGKNQQECC